MGCAGRHNPFFCPRYERDGVARVASEVVLPVGHHQNLAGGIASLNTPAKRGFFSQGKDLSLISPSCIKIL